jgi:hypothetical protein
MSKCRQSNGVFAVNRGHPPLQCEACHIASHRQRVGAAPPRHNMHVANTRMVVEGAVVVARVRMFRDDL